MVMVVNGWHLSVWALTVTMCVLALMLRDGASIFVSYLTLAIAAPSFVNAIQSDASIRVFGKVWKK